MWIVRAISLKRLWKSSKRGPPESASGCDDGGMSGWPDTRLLDLIKIDALYNARLPIDVLAGLCRGNGPSLTGAPQLTQHYLALTWQCRSRFPFPGICD